LHILKWERVAFKDPNGIPIKLDGEYNKKMASESYSMKK
jgi:hypothetical protein